MTIGKNFCLAPFTQITYGPLDTASPCPYLGGDIWNFSPNAKLKDIWLSEEYESLRKSFKENNKDIQCSRCWKEEEHGKQSARNINFQFKYKEKIVDFINGGYKSGPRQINLRVSNICNLRCRSCNSQSSVTFNIEGKYYEEKNNLQPTFYTKFPNSFEFSDQQIDGIIELSANLRRIEFYGGEPLVDKPTLLLLEKLIESGKSKEVTLFYNTNGITVPTQKHLDLWRHFESLEFNFSIDGVDNHFTYIRHPGKWEDLLKNVDFIKNKLPKILGIDVMCLAICTIQTLNIYYLAELINECNRLELKYFLNMVTQPDYYNIQHIPTEVKKNIINKLLELPQKSDVTSIISILELEYNEKYWEEFKFWTKQKDSYRKENFASTFPEFFELIKNHY
jgi:MoaA/NifB/PqqE/SkfB family radical SAM enzyme